MILEKHLQLEEKIVQILMKQPNLTATELWHLSSQSNESYTIQAVYKELRKLHETGVVTKSGTHFSLRIPWVLAMADMVEQAKKLYVDDRHFDHLLPNNKKNIWHFTNLGSLNNFWSQVLLVLINQSESKRIYGYSPHPWYHLLQTEQEDQYIKSLRHARTRLYLMVGGDTYLDKWAAQFWYSDIVEYSFAPSPYHRERGWYFDVIGDYLVSVTLDSTTTHAIEHVYQHTTDWEHLNLAAVLQLSQMRIRASLVLENNSRKAEIIRKRFTKFFGI